jgi:hypothetical protein
VLLVGCPWFGCACEVVSPVFGVDWLVVVEDLSEEVDDAFWADGAELREEVDEGAGDVEEF